MSLDLVPGSGLPRALRVREDRGRPELWVFAGSLLTHLVLLGLAFLWFDVALGTYEYREIARNLAQGHGFVLRPGEAPILWRPPLYIFFLAGLYAIFGDHHVPVVIVQAVLGAATAVIAYRIARRLFGETVGLGTAIVMTLHPLLWYNAGRVMTETLFTFLVSLIVLLSINLVTTPYWWTPPLLGVAVGLSALCRATFQFFPLALLALAVWPGAWSMAVGQRARQAGVVAFCTLAVLLPWSIRNAVVSGGYVIPVDTSAGYTVWVGNAKLTDGQDDDGLTPEGLAAMKRALASLLGVDPLSPEVTDSRIFERAWSAEGNRVLFHVALREATADPIATAWLAVKKLGRFWFSMMGEQNRDRERVVALLQIAVLVPAVVGAILAVRERRTVLPLFLVVGYLMVIHVAATANARYSVPILPYVVMLAVHGVWRLATLRLR